MSKFKTRYINYSDRGFNKKFEDLIFDEKKSNNKINTTVTKILKEIHENGDKGLSDCVSKFDKISVKKIKDLFISKDTLKKAYDGLEKEQKKALNIAADRIKKFHKRQIPKNFSYKDNLKVNLGLTHSPISSAGFYVPGGKAIYPSSVLMNAIPALVAGVERRVLVSPISDINQSSIVLAAAHVAKVTEFIRIGGAHAVAALAYGTKSISPVDKIVGPGNAYVAEAKRQVFGKVGIDSIAGPSEVLIVCDETANSDHVALDLLSQAEHDELAQSILITTSKEIAKEVKNSVEKFLKEIKNAGAIFIGPYTPEAVGDYIAGPNHVLPTNGTAKFSSGLGVVDFYKRTTIVNFNKNSLNELGKHVITLAEAEGLEAHARSVSIRIDK